ncbi:UDP-N-acetyl-D-mannosaminuronic acid dehydrogenase [Nannocystis exedens]|uniref:UDP-N-acetyl-D-mannosaminuronic acid dehydrogenase n=1 Tax=Nannocystis exedens TaxID=54 RepID=A0A1I1U7D2_9BACT|nr:UDP-N-acetyl-D-glucosamine 6-dehydrogenase [Nannocystis exedens]SFD66732.1 UDP-N-acetyl-D-mannosaminuronic acid dehydrogenase [Nannocystis exedens]
MPEKPVTISLNEPPSDGSAALDLDVCVVGLGYVGLPTAAVLATRGRRVAGFDLRRDILDTINAGRIHIVEPELDALVRAAVLAGTLRAVAEPVPARTFLICVPTPITSDHRPDLAAVEAASRALVPVLRPGNLVVLESTVPPGTLRDLVAPILRQSGLVVGKDLFLAHAPERVLPGAVLREVVENERIVGGLTDACTDRCAAFYEGFVRAEVHRTSAEVAEFTKLAENAYRDVNVAYANELANVSAHLNLDVWEVIRLANRHPRVQILRPGPGVGGHCIAVDPWFIAASAPEHTPLIQAARQVNDGRPERILGQIRRLAGKLRAPTIALLGLSYKPDIDDLRESPALHIAEAVHREALGEVLLVEPHLQSSPIAGRPLVSLDDALARADILAVLVAHRDFRRLRSADLLRVMVVDAVGLLAGADNKRV